MRTLLIVTLYTAAVCALGIWGLSALDHLFATHPVYQHQYATTSEPPTWNRPGVAPRPASHAVLTSASAPAGQSGAPAERGT